VGSVEIVEATIEQQPIFERLLELYQHDFSTFDDADVNEDGRYGPGDLDVYWSAPDRHPFLLRVDEHLAGFALVRTGAPTDMAEFFVMRKYRRRGAGTEFARHLFARFPGAWQVREIRANEPAQAFWRRIIPVPFEEAEWDSGPMQLFTFP
jgi:predicted acetyltransferase